MDIGCFIDVKPHSINPRTLGRHRMMGTLGDILDRQITYLSRLMSEISSLGLEPLPFSRSVGMVTLTPSWPARVATVVPLYKCCIAKRLICQQKITNICYKTLKFVACIFEITHLCLWFSYRLSLPVMRFRGRATNMQTILCPQHGHLT